jgi:hypothetical protein
LNISSASPGAFCQEDVSLLGGLAEFVSTAIGAATDLMTITARMCGLRRPEKDSIAGLQAAGVPGGRETPGLRDQFVANVLDPAGAERIAARERIEWAMDERQFEIVYQPVFDLRDGSMFALETLARFAPEPYRPPDVWLAEAHQAGLGVELELAPCYGPPSNGSASCPRGRVAVGLSTRSPRSRYRLLESPLL